MGDQVETLCERAQAGELAAGSELIAHFYERIYAWFRRLCGNDDDAADLTQRTFCKVWQALPGFDRRARFNTWLHSIAHHVYVDWRRKTNRLDGQSDAWWETCVAEEPSPFDNVAERETAHQLYALVERLNDEQRVTVHLHYFQGLTLQETADVLEVSVSTVKYRLRQALDFLQAKMAEPKLRAGSRL